VVGGGGRCLSEGPEHFHATVEWFGSVPGYDVLDPSPFASNPAAASLLKRLHQQAKSVVNFGLGFQHKVSERFSYYGAFTTDNTFNEKDDSGANSLSTWDIYHATAGREGDDGSGLRLREPTAAPSPPSTSLPAGCPCSRRRRST
jgi:hypothetical protein